MYGCAFAQVSQRKDVSSFIALCLILLRLFDVYMWCVSASHSMLVKVREQLLGVGFLLPHRL